MRIRTLTLYSLVYLLGITSSMAVHQVLPSADAAARLQSATGSTAALTQQIANRSIKSDRLPVKQANPKGDDKASLQVPAQITPNRKPMTDCKPLVDVPGRCFVDAGVHHNVA